MAAERPVQRWFNTAAFLPPPRGRLGSIIRMFASKERTFER
jgi:hypothetical protein